MHDLILGGQYNIGHICTRQQFEAGYGDRVAMRWIDHAMQRVDYTFADLEAESNRCANLLASLGLTAGDVVFTFLPKMPEQFFFFLGSLKLQLICGTLFSNFGEEALLDRLGDAGAKAVVTKKSLARRISKVRGRMPELKHLILVDTDEHTADTLSLKKLMQEASVSFDAGLTGPETPSVLHYTSGSTGKPKGALHCHRSVLMQSFSAKEVLQLSPEEVYWCTADQGWVTGTSYGIIGPWSLGVTQVHFGGVYDPSHWMQLIQEQQITVWYTAPTALRMLMREPSDLYSGYDLSSLKHIFSVGEPLNPEVISWGERVLGKTIYDTWFQTETGAIMITNRPGVAVHPGSMGIPVSGIEPAILADDGTEVATGEHGNLCLKSGWPSMFKVYLNAQEKYDSRFRDGYYYTGDTAWRDKDGYVWFVGRSDDVINTSGHLVSPFEVESALLEIAEIAESGVVGAPDELLFEKVVAFVALHSGTEWSEELDLKVRLYISNKVSSIACPHEILVVDKIPKNKSGKIMRRVLKARYLGTDEGDISTMEE